jgi:peptidoglycan/xylan/chitin deacetylase (PgdA/CDA1 family)
MFDKLIMKIIKNDLLRRMKRQIMNKFSGGALILVYHRIFDLQSDPQLLAVSPQNFADHLSILKQYCYPMSFPQIMESLEKKKFPKNGVVVTFDDGYDDNLYQAKPLLEQYGIPATVFVTTGYVGQGREFYWDELEGLLLQPGRLPETLALGVNSQSKEWDLGDTASYSGDDFERLCTWNLGAQNHPSQRQYLYQTLCEFLRPLATAAREKALDELRERAGKIPEARPTHRILSPDEVTQLADGGLIEVGAHSKTHPVLSRITEAEQWSEIIASKNYLEEALGKPVAGFSYPYGGLADYNRETVKLVQKAKFTWACANVPDLVGGRSDCWQLPRVLVRNWDGDEFLRFLRYWFQ